MYSGPVENTFPITIDKLAFGGAGVGRHGGKVVFVSGAYPGDAVLARVEKERPRFIEADVARIETASPLRRVPACPHTADCGGCPWMGLSYEAQREWKTKIVAEQFSHIAGTSVTAAPIVAAPRELGYRARVRVRAGARDGRVVVGYHRPRTNDLVDVAECPIASGGINRMLGGVRAFLSARPDAVAMIEEVVMETGWPEEGGRLRVGMSELPDADFGPALLEASGANGVALVTQKQMVFFGDNGLEMEIGGRLSLRYGPRVFSQVNPEANLSMVAKVRGLAGAGRGRKGLDLYSGMGNITLPLSSDGWRMTGVEVSRESAAAGQANALRLGLGAEFMVADAIHQARRFVKRGERFDVAVLDPPRSGARGVAAHLASITERVVYVSCNPPSLARDAKEFLAEGFRVVSVAPMDLFPNTFHVETVALFEK